MTDKEAIKLALEALEAHADIGIKSDKAITAIKEALAQPEQEDGCPVCGSDVHDRDALDKAEREIERLTALVTPALMQEPVGVKGYAMALNEVALKLRARYQNDLLSTPLWAEFEKARNKFASSIATPPAAQRTWVGLTDEVITKVVDSMPRGIKGWMSDWDLYDYARAIEAKLKQKNGYAEENT